MNSSFALVLALVLAAVVIGIGISILGNLFPSARNESNAESSSPTDPNKLTN